jgi:hypothetical protein
VRTELIQGEVILYQTRKHWITFVTAILITVGLSYIIYFLFKSILGGILFVVAGIWYFLAERKNNIWVITNKRIIDEWGVFTINSKETPLDKVNNLVYKKDIPGMVLNYGTIFIQSAAEKGETVIKMIPAPEKFVQAVSNAHEISISETLMECPFCKEIIKRDAIKCKHCGSLLREIDIQENMQTTENLEIKQEIPKTDLPDNKPEETELKENKYTNVRKIDNEWKNQFTKQSKKEEIL